MRTAADPAGRTVLGTINDCANGYTPWGTYLACEENFNAYFVNASGQIPATQRRYGIAERGFGYRWHEHDERFDAAKHPNEPNRFGWVVEIGWIPLVHGQGPLTTSNGFATQADVVIRARAAADAVGATKMDRPEWIAVSPVDGAVFCTMTNNNQRGGKDRPATDAANPRADNVFGHIVRWNEAGRDVAALTFTWDIFAQCGDPSLADPAKRGTVRGDAYGSPDGLWVDPRGVLWIQTDISTGVLGKGDYANLGNNMMLASDVRSGETRRFLVGPRGAEVTGLAMTPDMTTMFICIQHPGESPSERADPAAPKAFSSWPDGATGGRPRSATVVVRRRDGGVIGT